MSRSSPAARLGLDFEPGVFFSRAQARNDWLKPGSGEAITAHCALGAGLRAVLGRWWPGSVPGLPVFGRFLSAFGLVFIINPCISGEHDNNVYKCFLMFAMIGNMIENVYIWLLIGYYSFCYIFVVKMAPVLTTLRALYKVVSTVVAHLSISFEMGWSVASQFFQMILQISRNDLGTVHVQATMVRLEKNPSPF